jgi:hypothetical protein
MHWEAEERWRDGYIAFQPSLSQTAPVSAAPWQASTQLVHETTAHRRSYGHPKTLQDLVHCTRHHESLPLLPPSADNVAPSSHTQQLAGRCALATDFTSFLAQLCCLQTWHHFSSPHSLFGCFSPRALSLPQQLSQQRGPLQSAFLQAGKDGKEQQQRDWDTYVDETVLQEAVQGCLSPG